MHTNILACTHCKSTNLKVLTGDDEPTLHYGRIACDSCGRFIKWLSKPKAPEISITRLLQSTSLESWERKFLKAIIYRTPTKAEVIVIEAIQLRLDPDHTGQGVTSCEF